MALTQKQATRAANAAYDNAFPGKKRLDGTDAEDKDNFVRWWANKMVQDGNDTALRDALRSDKGAGGVYETYRNKGAGGGDNVELIEHNGNVFRKIGNTITHIPDAETFNSLGYDWNDIQKVDNVAGLNFGGEPIQSVNTSPDIASGETELIEHNGNVFKKEGNTITHIPDPETLQSLGYSVNDVEKVDSVAGLDFGGEPIQSVNAPQGPLGYDDWLKGPGQSYADAYDPVNLEKEYGPYYAQQIGGLNERRAQAETSLTRNTQRTTERFGEQFAEAGLYGSGAYQQELGQAVGDLSRQYEQTWGSGEYTPYSLRLGQIEQDKKEALAGADITRRGQAWNVYERQYVPNYNN